MEIGRRVSVFIGRTGTIGEVLLRITAARIQNMNRRRHGARALLVRRRGDHELAAFETHAVEL